MKGYIGAKICPQNERMKRQGLQLNFVSEEDIDIKGTTK